MRSAWFLLAVPGTSAVLATMLYLSAVAERRLLSPRTLILGAMRARRGTPEFAEDFVARQYERLLREDKGGWGATGVAPGRGTGSGGAC